MAIDTTTVSLLTSVLASSAIRDFFKDIARQRFGEIDSLRAKTAKGLKVARDLESLPVG